jgi:hypothetical protein
MAELIEEIAEQLRGFRFPTGRESDMQQAVAAALSYRAVEWTGEREFRLAGASPNTTRGTIDFLIRPVGITPIGRQWIGIECKVDGSPSAVVQQLIRYAEAPELSGLILLTSRPSHVRELAGVETLQGKPFRIVATFAGGFV